MEIYRFFPRERIVMRLVSRTDRGAGRGVGGLVLGGGVMVGGVVLRGGGVMLGPEGGGTSTWTAVFRSWWGGGFFSFKFPVPSCGDWAGIS